MCNVLYRYYHIDMAKGLLISLVVLGHMLSDCVLSKVIFWFHVPAFFILSGIFLRDETANLKDELFKRWKRLIVPYFVYSLILGTIARSGDVVKQVVGTVWGAGGNITSFTFCYYFVTVLYLSVMMFCFLTRCVSSRNRWVVIGVIYLSMQVLCRVVPEKWLNFVPWNADMGMYALVFLALGFLLKGEIKQNTSPETGRSLLSICCVSLSSCASISIFIITAITSSPIAGYPLLT